MTKVQPWATHVTHDGPTEHWRVTALLAKDAYRLWDALCKAPDNVRDSLPNDAKVMIPILYRRLELTDYFLSGLAEGENHVPPIQK